MFVARKDASVRVRFTREELEVALHDSHWIPRLRSGSRGSTSQVTTFLPRLKLAGVLVRDHRHFTGLRVRSNLVAVDLHDDGLTVRHERTGTTSRKVTIHPNRASGK